MKFDVVDNLFYTVSRHFSEKQSFSQMTSRQKTFILKTSGKFVGGWQLPAGNILIIIGKRIKTTKGQWNGIL